MNPIKNLLSKLFFTRTIPQATGTIKGSVIAVRVTKIIKHPNADRLRLITVTDGHQSYEPIVCGAFNFDEGAIVVLALPGARIAHNIHSDAHEPFMLDKATIRGIESQGMICAAFELGISPEIGEGVIILPEDTPLGKIIT